MYFFWFSDFCGLKMAALLHSTLTCIAIVIGWISRLIGSVFARHHAESTTPRRLLLFLGSGGHTTELLSIIKSLDFSDRFKATFVISSGDQLSIHKLNGSHLTNYDLIHIVRARRVGQSYFTSIFTTIAAMIHSFSICFRTRPDLFICNGPGTSIPLCVASKMVGAQCIYIESFCRTRSLSLSAKMAAHIVDHLLVQYPQLISQHPHVPRLKYIGLLV